MRPGGKLASTWKSASTWLRLTRGSLSHQLIFTMAEAMIANLPLPINLRQIQHPNLEAIKDEPPTPVRSACRPPVRSACRLCSSRTTSNYFFRLWGRTGRERPRRLLVFRRCCASTTAPPGQPIDIVHHRRRFVTGATIHMNHVWRDRKLQRYTPEQPN